MRDDGRKNGSRRREATTVAILDAAEELFAAQGFTAVTVRAIAEHAGVSHALVHRYVGRKIDIWNAVIERNALGILQAAPDNPDLLETASLMIRDGLTRHRRYVRLVAHSGLHGLSSGWPPGIYGATERLVELAERAAASAPPTEPDENLDPRFIIACVVALFIGWGAMESWVLARTGLQDMDEGEAVAGLERVVRGILKANLPGVGDDEPEPE